jgi:hypothetical protein
MRFTTVTIEVRFPLVTDQVDLDSLDELRSNVKRMEHDLTWLEKVVGCEPGGLYTETEVRTSVEPPVPVDLH